MFIELPISFSSNIDRAIHILSEEALKHPYCKDNRTAGEKNAEEPAVVVRVISITDYAVMLRANVWVDGPSSGFILKCDLLKSIKQRFDAEGIEIPYRSVTIKEYPST
jgi:small-conductance mechanosensitive channel